jgi:hypothetical protein
MKTTALEKAEKLVREHPDNKELMDGRSVCSFCGGDGWTAEHNPEDTSVEHMEYGHCTSCPVQIQCDRCQANGFTPTKPTHLEHYLRVLGI